MNTQTARDRILGRLRAVHSAVPPAPTFAPIKPAIAPGLSIEDAITQFRAGSELFHAEVIDTRGSDWRQALAECCTAKNVRRLMLPPALELPPWPNAPLLTHFNQPMEIIKRELFDETDAGLTLADGAIADTGTLFQIDPQTMPRTLSLVPPIHFCVLNVHRILPTLTAAIASEGWQASMPSNLIFITGPSKTADIQQTLAYGAHGPKELVVLLTESAQ
jgi:L-lactate dehydrogenase complex protein LldG